MNTTTPNVLYFLDVNVAANAGGNLGGVFDVSEWYSYHPGAPLGVRVINRLIELGLPMATSRTALDTLAHQLQKQNASDFEALDEESAHATAASFLALVHAMDGVSVSTDEVRRFVRKAKSMVSSHLHGSVYGTIDHEDFTIIASVLAAMKKSGAKSAVIVTEDHGLQNCARDLARAGARQGAGISVLSSERMLDMLRSRAVA